MAVTETKKPNLWLKLIIEIAPIIVFFKFYDAQDPQSVFTAVAAFMAAMFISLIASKIILKEISMMLKISGVMVAIMGGLTLYFENDTFFKMKPTVVNVILGTILLVGYFRKKAFLKVVFEAGFPPMEQKGWMLLSRNIALWYFGFAILNEFIWRNFTLEQWMWSKLWVSIPLSFIMMAFQVPVMQKYILPEEELEEKK